MWALSDKLIALFALTFVICAICSIRAGRLVGRFYAVGYAAGLLLLAAMTAVGMYVQDGDTESALYLSYKLLHLLVGMISQLSQSLLYIKIFLIEGWMYPLIGVVVIYLLLLLGLYLFGYSAARLLDLIIAVVSRVIDGLLTLYVLGRVTQLQMRLIRKVGVTILFFGLFIARGILTSVTTIYFTGDLHTCIEASYCEAALTLVLTIAPTLWPAIVSIAKGIFPWKPAYLLVRQFIGRIISSVTDRAISWRSSDSLGFMTRGTDAVGEGVAPELTTQTCEQV